MEKTVPPRRKKISHGAMFSKTLGRAIMLPYNVNVWLKECSWHFLNCDLCQFAFRLVFPIRRDLRRDFVIWHYCKGDFVFVPCYM